MAKAPTSQLSPMEELEQLDRRREELRKQVHDEAHGRLKSELDRFNGMNLGRTYELRETGARSGRQASAESRKGTRSVNAERPCPICGFKTIPPHDARAHRSQGEKKRAFTAEELSSKGMTKA